MYFISIAEKKYAIGIVPNWLKSAQSGPQNYL